ncbi:MAG: PhnD/SsuA/transferrin family substrate-binding protein [Acidobacteriota bacterium]
MRVKVLLIAWALVTAFVGGVGALLYSSVVDISKPFGLLIADPPVPAPNEREYALAVVSRFSPSLTFRRYQPIADALAERTPYRFTIRACSNYRDALAMVESGEVVAAFVGTYIFAESEGSSSVEPVLRPLTAAGEPFHRAVVIVRGESPVFSLDDLRGQTLAVPSRESFSGNWLSRACLNRFGISAGDFAAVKHFEHHHSVVFEVQRNQFAGGVVKEPVAQEFLDAGIRIVARSELIPSSPVIVRSGNQSEPVLALRKALLELGAGDDTEGMSEPSRDDQVRFGFAPASGDDYRDISRRIQGCRDDAIRNGHRLPGDPAGEPGP